MSAITGDPSYPNFSFSNLTNLTQLLNTPASQEPIYPDLSTLSSPPPPFNPDYNPDLVTDIFSYPPPVFLPIIPLNPKDQIFSSERIEVPSEYRSPEDTILSQDLRDELDGLMQVHFNDYDPWHCDSKNPIHGLIDQMHKETTSHSKFTLFQKREDASQEVAEEGTEAASAQRLKLCEQAIYEIEQLPNLDAGLKRLLEVGFRHTMTIDLANYERILFMNKFVESNQVSPHIEQLRSDLIRFETRGGQYPEDYLENLWSTLLIGVSYHINNSLKERAAVELLTQPLEIQLEKCQYLIRSLIDSLNVTPPVRYTLESSIYQPSSVYQDSTFSEFLVEQYVLQGKQAFEQGKLKPQEFDEMLKILHALNPNSNPLFPFIEQVLGTLEISTLRQKIEKDAIDQKFLIQVDNRVAAPVRQFFRQCVFWKNSAAKQQEMKIDTSQKGKLHFLDHVEKLIAGLQPIDELASDFELISDFYMIPSNPVLLKTAEAPALPVPSEPSMVEVPILPASTMPQVLSPSALPISTLPVRKPEASYIHVAFPQLLELILPDQNPYKLFTKPVRKDLLRHLFYIRLMGPVEERIEEAFKKRVDGSTIHHVNAIYRKKLKRLEEQSNGIAITTDAKLGEKILDLYYKGKQSSPEFKDSLSTFPANETFFKHFFSQAQASKAKNVPLNEDLDWARRNYRNPQFIHLTMQALERYLHA